MHRALFASVSALALLGCSEVSGEGAGELTKPEAFTPEEVGATYPEEPYGVAKGNVIRNYKLSGLVNATADSSTEQAIQLADFYNPTGDGKFPAGSAYGEGPMPRALLVNVSALWCAPCKEEARSTLPAKYAELGPLGAEFFVVLAEGGQPGSTVEWEHLLAWTRTFHLNYPAAIDPKGLLGALFSADTYPANMVIDTTTMKIAYVVTGAPDEAFWGEFRALLGG